MSYGVGILHGTASKQKLNTKFTMETEFSEVSVYVTYKIHIINIFLGKFYDLHKIFCTMTLKAQLRRIRTAETHAQVIQGTFPTDIFFNDRVYKEEFIIEYCNTSAMLANFFTKTLQGPLFWSFIEGHMVWQQVDILKYYVPPPKKERIENHVSRDKLEIKQKVTYAQIVTGDRIGSADGS